MKMYYALRRLGKEVAWVSYTNGGHGMPTSTVEEVRDYHRRIVSWYDDHLKGDLKKKAEEAKAKGGQQLSWPIILICQQHNKCNKEK